MKRVLKLTSWCFAAVVMWAATPALAADAFARHFPLELEDGAAFYSVTLPAAIYAASRRSDLGDVRVFNGAGEPVPYSLDTPREPARKPPILRSVNWFPLPLAAAGGHGNGTPSGIAIAADGSLRATAAPPPRAEHDVDLVDVGRASRNAQLSALVVHLRDDNFQGRVTVEASDDLRHWQPAGDAQLLKVRYNGGTLSQDRIELDGTHGRYLRLHWLDGVPFVDSLDMEVRAASADHPQWADAQREWREGIVGRAGPRAGEYFFSTGGPYPVDRLRLNLPQPDTVAPAVVYSRASLQAPWREVASATLFRLHNGSVEQSSPALDLTPDTDRQWRVVVDARSGGLGNGTLTVAVGWTPAMLTFAARGTAPFTLAVGNAAARSAAVTHDALLTGASSVVATAMLGDAQSAALSVAHKASAELPVGGPDVSRRYLLWTALLLAVGSLVAIAWWLARVAQSRAGEVAGELPGSSGRRSATADDRGSSNADAGDAGNQKE